MEIIPSITPSGDVRIYEFGARLDHDCVQAVNDQLFAAHQLYNRLVASIRDTVEAMRAYLIEQAGPDGEACQARVDALNAAFAEAKADNDEARMQQVAQDRRIAWRELAGVLKVARKACKSELQERFFSRIGKKATCETYRLRCQAVADGLGWATANATLDAALVAFKKSFVRGHAPRFAKAAESTQDTLTLQFTQAGGISAGALLEGRNSEFCALARDGCGRRKYGSFTFRVGAAKAGVYATGTWQYHRPLPADGSVGLVRLVRRRVGPKTRWYLQCQVRSPLPETQPSGRAPLVAIHFGWAPDVSGRRVAGLADAADPGCATVLRLPAEIEAALQRAAEVESERGKARDAVVEQLKSHVWPEDLLAAADADTDGLDPEAAVRVRAATELAALRRLPAHHVAVRRLHRLARQLRDAGCLPEWLEAWRKTDKLRWQEAAFGARRARNRRRSFYRDVAARLAAQYQAIAIEPLDLAGAAQKIDETTGKRSDFARKARAGRVVAALYEFESALRWAAAKHGTAVFDLVAETARHCAYCGDSVSPDEDDSQVLHCVGCGAEVDRKRNGAAVAYQAMQPDLEQRIEDYWRLALAEKAEAEAKRKEKKAKMAAGRKAARAAAAEGMRALG